MKNAVAITGATSAAYTTPAVTVADNGSLFSVKVTNPGGSVTSVRAKLTVRIPPAITTQPANKSIAVGKTAKFTVAASGTAPLSYRRKNSSNITGAILASYTTPAALIGDNGSLFSVVVTNGAGSATSADALLTVK